jgi:hypothetical protein
MGVERVSRWFAVGFRAGADGKQSAALPLSACENEWQKADMRAGYEEGLRRQAHIQFWLVSGDWNHAEVKQNIITTNTEGVKNVEGSGIHR